MNDNVLVFQDAMQYAAESRDNKAVEELLEFFVSAGLKECFSACLYQCYDMLRPDVVVETAWRNQLFDQAMPYLINSLRELSSKVERLEQAETVRTQNEEKAEQETNPLVFRKFIRMLFGNSLTIGEIF